MELGLGKYQLLATKDLELDAKNPRIAKWLEIYSGAITADQMALALNAASGEGEDAGPSVSSLKESIKTNKGIIHPIIVNLQADGKYVVIEGNTRTLIYREFQENGVPGNWEKIPSIVYRNLISQQIDAIRLQAHLVGPRAWDPYSKAKYLDFLSNCEYMTTDQIVAFCGGKQQEVLNYIAAYRDMEKHYRPLLESDDEFDPTRFSAFVELQRPRVIDSLMKNKMDKSDFSQWIIDGKIHPLATVRQLPRILENKKCREVFFKDGIQEAMKYLEVPDIPSAIKEASLYQIAQELINRINTLPYQEFNRLKDAAYEEERDIMINASSLLSALCKDIKTDE